MDNFRDSYFQVDWDLTTKRLKGTYWGKQYDTGRGFAVTVINGGQVVTATNEVLRLKWEKPDNTTGYVNATIVDGKFIVENIDQMFTVHGSVRADFELSVGGEFVASITFYVNVEKAVAVDAIESSSDFTALQTAIGTVDGFDAEIASLQTDFDTFSTTLQSDFNSLEDEIIDARQGEMSLGANITEVKSQLADITNVKYLQNGKIKLPSTFPSLPFNISKNGLRKFSHDANPHNQFDWTGATEIFISEEIDSSGSGTSVQSPISFYRFKANLGNSIYGDTEKFILTVLDNVSVFGSSRMELVDRNIDILIRSGSVNGFSWLGRYKRGGVVDETSAWVEDSGVYKTTQTTNHTVIDVLNFNALDNYGVPKPYTKVTTLAECQNNKGTFYQLDSDVWCNPYDEENIEYIALQITSVSITISDINPRTIMFENIGFASNTLSVTGGNLDSKYYFFGCKFYRSLYDAFAITGLYKTYLFDCVAGYGSKDGFNYHSSSIDSLAVEVNCISYGNGMYKLDAGNTTTNSNNGSTAHDGMKVLRVGSKYWECEGPIVADVNDCYSISIGCEATNILQTANGIKAGFLFYNDGGDLTNRNKYVIECLSSGENMLYGIQGTTETYYQNFTGKKTFNGEISEIDWEVVSNE